jgi:hypothetical protein
MSHTKTKQFLEIARSLPVPSLVYVLQSGRRRRFATFMGITDLADSPCLKLLFTDKVNEVETISPNQIEALTQPLIPMIVHQLNQTFLHGPK